MEYQRTIDLLSLLYPAAEGTDKEKILALFRDVVALQQDFQQLSKYLQTAMFLGPDATHRHEEGVRALADAVSDIQNAARHMRQLTLLVGQIGNELAKANALLSSPRFFDEDFFAMPAADVDGYRKFYRAMASVICYYLASQFGIKSIRNLTFQSGAGFMQTVRLVNQQYANELAMSTNTDRPAAWQISAVPFSGDNFTGYNGYTIAYLKDGDGDSFKTKQPEQYRRLAPYLYGAVSSASGVQLMGIGNLVGVTASSALSLLDAPAVETISLDLFGDKDILPADPLAELAQSLGTQCFCLSPERYVSALNRWSIHRAVKARRGVGSCIFCGKPPGEGRFFCTSHFSVNR